MQETFDETIANNEFEDASSKWDEADVLLLTHCSDLTLRFVSTQDGIADKFDGKVLIVEHIDELYVPEFLAGAPYNDFKSFSTIEFRHLMFKQIPSYLEFKDRVEVVMYNITLSEDFPSTFEIRIENEAENLDPVFRMQKSTFKDLSGLTQLQTNPLKIVWKNKQKDGTRCNYDYKGQFILENNDFGYLNNEVSKMVQHFLYFRISRQILNFLSIWWEKLSNCLRLKILGRFHTFSINSFPIKIEIYRQL